VNPLLIALLGVMLVPLFVATWRTSLLGLSGQGLLMALIASSLIEGPSAVGDWITLVDLGLVRGLVVPVALYLVVRRQDVPARLDVIPPTLLSWSVALGMVLGAFNVAQILVTPAGEQQTLVAVATAGFLLGFLVLVSRGSTLSQIIGALRIENAIALLELGGGRHHADPIVQAGLLVVFVITVGFFRWYLATVPGRAVATPAAVEGPTL